jgi:hypothetical protein
LLVSFGGAGGGSGSRPSLILAPLKPFPDVYRRTNGWSHQMNRHHVHCATHGLAAR